MRSAILLSACALAASTVPAIVAAQHRGGPGWHRAGEPGPDQRPDWGRGDRPGPDRRPDWGRGDRPRPDRGPAWRDDDGPPPPRRRCPPSHEGSIIGAIAGGLLGGQPVGVEQPPVGRDADHRC